MSLSRPALIINKCFKSLFRHNPTFRRNMSSSARLCTPKVSETQLDQLIKQLAPPLTNDKHKGQAGRIGVFGGSLEYTGAPFFAAISALRLGADLSHVFCCRDAAPVIKSYSPELIVHPLLDQKGAVAQIEPWLDRLHVILIGPGLGRDESIFKVLDAVLELCRVRQKPLVIDADGLYYISLNPHLLRNYPSPIILTPNAIEFERLVGKATIEATTSKKDLSGKFLALAENLTLVCKGHEDEIFNRDTYVKVSQGGSGRRCGGQGDLLSGTAATFLAWALQQAKPPGTDDRAVVAAYAACKLARECNHRAFAKMGRSMITSDMLLEIHGAFEELCGRP